MLTKLWHDSCEARGCCSYEQVFRGANVKLGNWRQVTVQITKGSSKYVGILCVILEDTHGNVYSHRLSYFD